MEIKYEICLADNGVILSNCTEGTMNVYRCDEITDDDVSQVLGNEIMSYCVSDDMEDEVHDVLDKLHIDNAYCSGYRISVNISPVITNDGVDGEK